MRSLLASLPVRLGLTFLFGLVLLQLAVMVALLWPDGRPAVFNLVSPTESVAIARALESTPPEQQGLFLDVFNTGPLHVQLLPAFRDEQPDLRISAAPRLERYLGDYASQLEGRAFAVQTRQQAAPGPWPLTWFAGPSTVRILVRLKTGQGLILERTPVFLQRLGGRMLWLAVAVALVLLGVMAICILQVARPARRLATAAHQFATNIDMPDLPVRGAAEIRTLSSAFNLMKRTIRELMDDRTRFLAAIAHDLRTYLTRLRLRIEFIDSAEHRMRAREDIEEMSLLLDDTLMFAREATIERSLPPEPIDIGRELAEFVEVRREIGDPVTLVTPDGGLFAHCAPLALRRMLANLTDNAIRYGKSARLGALQEGDFVSISVEDDGPGAPIESFERLVQPFERLDGSRSRQTGGAGLGLAIVNALAKSQLGELILSNRPEGGMKAVICLSAAVSGP